MKSAEWSSGKWEGRKSKKMYGEAKPNYFMKGANRRIAAMTNR
jgi:hypothetical protein